MAPPFEAALGAAVDLLRSLPHDRAERAVAEARFADFAEQHPEARARLVVDARPGSPRIEHDVLLEHPEQGTVGITWCADDGTPWAITYADHWASNLVVSVDDGDVTIQETLLFLKMAAEKSSDLMELIVSEKIVATAVQAEPSPVEREELQAAADAFRIANGLLTETSMKKRLDEWGISLARFQQMLVEAIQRRKFRARVADEDIDAYFEAHRADLDTIRAVVVRTPSRAVAERVARAAEGQGLVAAAATVACDPDVAALTSEIRTDTASVFPGPIASAGAGGRIGPFEHDGAWSCAAVLERLPATLDVKTRETVQRAIFDRWLADRRDAVTVKWHWL